MGFSEQDKCFRVDFIGIGAPRSGTSWVARSLEEHPEVCFSSTKETHFFDRVYKTEKDLVHYRTHFKNLSPGKVIGEFTPSYYLNDEIARRIKKHFPRAKIIVCLRNPAERAVSHLQYNVRKGSRGRRTNMTELIQKNDPVVTAGFYYYYLGKFLNILIKTEFT